MDFDQQLQEAQLRRQRFAQQLAGAQDAPQGRMVGNVYIAPNALQYAAQALRGIGAMRGEQLAGNEIAQLNQQRNQALADTLRRVQSKFTGTPAEVLPEGQQGPTRPAVPPDLHGGFALMAASPFQQLQQAGVQGMMTSAQQEAERARAEQDRRRQAELLQTLGPQEAVRQGLVSIEDAQKFMDAENLGRVEVARTVEVQGPNGEKLVQGLDRFGRPVGDPMPAYMAPTQINLGDRVVFANPSAGDQFSVGLSPSQREISARATAKQNIPAPAPQLPTSALRMEQEGLDRLGIFNSVNSDLAALEKQIEDNQLSFGPVSNLVNQGLNLAGVSTQQSRNFATFKSTLERLRNESLRLNTGVQTDGDAQRAWNELFSNITDTNLVKQRLQEIQRINARGAELQRLRLDGIRLNYGLPPLDVTDFQNVTSALAGGVSSTPSASAATPEVIQQAPVANQPARGSTVFPSRAPNPAQAVPVNVPMPAGFRVLP